MSEIFHGPLWPYLLVIFAGFLPTDVWRWAAVVFGRKLDEDSEIMTFIRGVANAMVAGVIMKLVLFPTGDLAAVPLWLRGGAVVLSFAAYFVCRRSMLIGVLAGEALLITGAYFTLPH
jgi:branched-subunit amino acid transport protein AzlD